MSIRNSLGDLSKIYSVIAHKENVRLKSKLNAFIMIHKNIHGPLEKIVF